jgi:peptidoglycan-N-acetylglucosamine deacetylase
MIRNMIPTLAKAVSLTLSFLVSMFGLLKAQAVDHSGQAIICLTYDDGLETQLTTVIPQLDSFGLKATFFLNSIKGSASGDKIGQSPEAVLGWSNAARHGHELAGHTMFHACPMKLGWDSSISSDTYTVDRIVQEIRLNNEMLSLLDTEKRERSFAYPCNNSMIGGVDYSSIIFKKRLVKYARAGGDSTSVISNYYKLDFMKVPSWHVWTGTTLDQMISFAEKAHQQNGMGVYQLHGVGGQVFQISSETHRSFLAYLKSHPNEYWVTTFSEAMDYIKSRRQ